MHRLLLRIFRRLPAVLRRAVVRRVAPQYTVGAICLIERADGRVLLIQQSYRQRWGLPGGLLEKGEAPAAAAVREVREEVGLDIALVGEPALVVDPAPRRCDIVYRARPADEDGADEVTPCSPEITAVQWFSPLELPELQHETAAALQALARASYAPPARVLPA